MKVGTAIVVTVAGVGAGMIIADIVTKGAVREAASDLIAGIRNKGGEVAEAAVDAAETVADNVTELASDAADVVESI